jgi:hypothetical protein
MSPQTNLKRYKDGFASRPAENQLLVAVLCRTGKLESVSRSYRFLECFGPSAWEKSLGMSNLPQQALKPSISQLYRRNAFVLTKSGLTGWSEFADLVLAREDFCLAVPANHSRESK